MYGLKIVWKFVKYCLKMKMVVWKYKSNTPLLIKKKKKKHISLSQKIKRQELNHPWVEWIKSKRASYQKKKKKSKWAWIVSRLWQAQVHHMFSPKRCRFKNPFHRRFGGNSLPCFPPNQKPSLLSFLTSNTETPLHRRRFGSCQWHKR